MYPDWNINVGCFKTPHAALEVTYNKNDMNHNHIGKHYPKNHVNILFLSLSKLYAFMLLVEKRISK